MKRGEGCPSRGPRSSLGGRAQMMKVEESQCEEEASNTENEHKRSAKKRAPKHRREHGRSMDSSSMQQRDSRSSSRCSWLVTAQQPPRAAAQPEWRPAAALLPQRQPWPAPPPACCRLHSCQRPPGGPAAARHASAGCRAAPQWTAPAAALRARLCCQGQAPARLLLLPARRGMLRPPLPPAAPPLPGRGPQGAGCMPAAGLVGTPAWAEGARGELGWGTVNGRAASRASAGCRRCLSQQIAHTPSKIHPPAPRPARSRGWQSAPRAAGRCDTAPCATALPPTAPADGRGFVRVAEQQHDTICRRFILEVHFSMPTPSPGTQAAHRKNAGVPCRRLGLNPAAGRRPPRPPAFPRQSACLHHI